MAKTISVSVNQQHSLIFQAWRCILGSHRNAIYVSGPITTGPRFIVDVERNFVASDGVIQANIDDILKIAHSLREETGRIVIEPGSLAVPSWSQDDYLELWTSLIERHIAEVRFLNGWDASIGCALEYERAWLHDIERRFADGAIIEHDQAIFLLTNRSASLIGHPNDRLADLGMRLAQVVKRLSGPKLHEKLS
ncbi:DUF4406 domain-containing protein [Novosphingobium sp. KACC 22771]|uniref:DUF4406 domain-containing protein n=1 Tax=Novosphingobium sp. KACC 22771 TaxID=3025670 RepID=UPI0023665E5C|nr:DUF4406 domain-containing protein [Novosphingobium sp. KACC 22771]WDF74191.1 DUF4406 domain-containing protein [Novosphingobium sp. KACC 22771]